MQLPCYINNKQVFDHFINICSIPHGSGNTKQISDFCVNFAKLHGLEYSRDSYDNVIIKKPASCGYEDHPGVILQGHLDMVCEKTDKCDIDFDTEGLRLDCDDKYLFAQGTTLGADDGIAVAMILSVLSDKTAVHPPLTAVFTTDEEVGMTGAANIDFSGVNAKTLINIDSEEEGILTVSCAGGAKCEMSIDVKYTACKYNIFSISVSGLAGGHSGMEINSGRINADILTAGLLKFLNEKSVLRICSISGGLKDNAIPRQCLAVVDIDIDKEKLVELCKSYFSASDLKTEKNLKFEVEKANDKNCFDDESTSRVIGFLNSIPNGMIKMSDNIPDLVQTSLNLGKLWYEGNKLYTTLSIRSSVDREKQQLISEVGKTAEKFDADIKVFGQYPAWEYRKISRLSDVMQKVYKKMFSVKPQVKAIHAGLECGLFCGKIDDLDAVSFGPDILDIHTPDERLDLKSADRMYDYLINVLREL